MSEPATPIVRRPRRRQFCDGLRANPKGSVIVLAALVLCAASQESHAKIRAEIVPPIETRQARGTGPCRYPRGLDTDPFTFRIALDRTEPTAGVSVIGTERIGAYLVDAAGTVLDSQIIVFAERARNRETRDVVLPTEVLQAAIENVVGPFTIYLVDQTRYVDSASRQVIEPPRVLGFFSYIALDSYAFNPPALDPDCPAQAGQLTVVARTQGHAETLSFQLVREAAPEGRGLDHTFEIEGADNSSASRVLSGYPPGRYRLTQQAHEAFDLTRVACIGDADQGNVVQQETGTVLVDLDAGEVQLCEFVNVQRSDDAALTVALSVDGEQGDPFDIKITKENQEAISVGLADKGRAQLRHLAPGPVLVRHSPPPIGYRVRVNDCVGDQDQGNTYRPAARELVVDLDPREIQTCAIDLVSASEPASLRISTLIRGPAASLEVRYKGDIPGQSNFTLTTLGTASNQRLFSDLQPGSYEVGQAAINDYNFVEVVCTGDLDGGNSYASNAVARFDLDAGEQQVCSFVIEPKNAKLSFELGSLTASSTSTLCGFGGRDLTFEIEITKKATGNRAGIRGDANAAAFLVDAKGEEFGVGFVRFSSLDRQETRTALIRAYPHDPNPGPMTIHLVDATDYTDAPAPERLTFTDSGSVFALPVRASRTFNANSLNRMCPGHFGKLIVRNSAGETAFASQFTTEGRGLRPFGLTVPTNGAAEQEFVLFPGTYRVSQVGSSTPQLQALSCSGDNDGGNLIDPASQTIDVDLDPGEQQICLFRY